MEGKGDDSPPPPFSSSNQENRVTEGKYSISNGTDITLDRFLAEETMRLELICEKEDKVLQNVYSWFLDMSHKIYLGVIRPIMMDESPTISNKNKGDKQKRIKEKMTRREFRNMVDGFGKKILLDPKKNLTFQHLTMNLPSVDRIEIDWYVRRGYTLKELMPEVENGKCKTLPYSVMDFVEAGLKWEHLGNNLFVTPNQMDKLLKIWNLNQFNLASVFGVQKKMEVLAKLRLDANKLKRMGFNYNILKNEWGMNKKNQHLLGINHKECVEILSFPKNKKKKSTFTTKEKYKTNNELDFDIEEMANIVTSDLDQKDNEDDDLF